MWSCWPNQNHLFLSLSLTNTFKLIFIFFLIVFSILYLIQFFPWYVNQLHLYFASLIHLPNVAAVISHSYNVPSWENVFSSVFTVNQLPYAFNLIQILKWHFIRLWHLVLLDCSLIVPVTLSTDFLSFNFFVNIN